MKKDGFELGRNSQGNYIAKMTNYIRIGAALYPMRYRLRVEAVVGGNYWRGCSC
jgi:hypothetical protein